MGTIQRVLSKKNRALLSELVKTDFKLRYQGSMVGYLWSLLRPLFMFMILYVVFTKVFPLGKGIPHYPVYLFMGIILWNFFAETTQQGLSSIVARGDLIRKISIPRWLIVLSTSISALINLGLNLTVLVVFMALNHVTPMVTIAWLPLIILEVYIFALGLAYFLAAVFVKFRDIQFIWELFIQAGFYVTPILYPLTQIPNIAYQKMIFMNPMAQAVQDARWSVVAHHPSIVTIHSVFDGGWYRLIPYSIVVITFMFGVWYFARRADTFAEDL
ncbi:MAG TPA: ABC transporter permease [Candidatus Saccharibacteria bacterium]|nr:ABC transporter permease [Candidatus Saccharibacteria bacterium]